MPLNQAQLMTTPGGAGSVAGYPGAVKAGTGITIGTDGTVSVDPATNITKLTAGSGITLNPSSGVGNVTISSSTTGGVTSISGSQYITASSATGNVTLQATGLLPLTGGVITGPGGSSTPGTLLIQSPLATPGPAPLLLLKGPGSFPGDAGTTTSFILGCYDATHNIGASWRYYDPDPNTPGSDFKFSNQVATDEDNLWVWSARQLRLNSDLTGGTNLFSFFQFGSGPNGGRLVSYINSSGQYIIQNGTEDPVVYSNPPTTLTGNALNMINGLTAKSWSYLITPMNSETNLPSGTPFPSATMYGFLPEDVEANCPLAFESDPNTAGTLSEGGVNYNAIFVVACQAIQELSSQLDDLRAEFDAYVAAHP